jgi:hypothetical protein
VVIPESEGFMISKLARKEGGGKKGLTPAEVGAIFLA